MQEVKKTAGKCSGRQRIQEEKKSAGKCDEKKKNDRVKENCKEM